MPKLNEWYPEFEHPDHVGQSEYRAIFECCQDALDSMKHDGLDSERHRDEMILNILDEFCSLAGGTASEIRERIQKRSPT